MNIRRERQYFLVDKQTDIERCEMTKTAHKFAVNIEGTLFEWDRETVTADEIRELAGFDPGQQIVEVDLKDNIERTIGEDEVIDLKPGRGFGKKVRFQRG